METNEIDEQFRKHGESVLPCQCHKHDEPCTKEASPQWSMGIPAGHWCDECWDHSGYRKGGPEIFDPGYAGEEYWEEENRY